MLHLQRLDARNSKITFKLLKTKQSSWNFNTIKYITKPSFPQVLKALVYLHPVWRHVLREKNAMLNTSLWPLVGGDPSDRGNWFFNRNEEHKRAFIFTNFESPRDSTSGVTSSSLRKTRKKSIVYSSKMLSTTSICKRSRKAGQMIFWHNQEKDLNFIFTKF